MYTFPLPNHLLMDSWVASTFLALAKNAAMDTCANISWRRCFQFFGGVYPEVEPLDPTVTMFHLIIYLEKPILHFPTQSFHVEAQPWSVSWTHHWLTGHLADLGLIFLMKKRAHL